MKLNLMIELTNRCNLRCPTCFSHQDNREKRDMTFNDFKKFLDENHMLIDSLSLYNYGEPLLNKDLPLMIAYAKKKRVSYIKIATNGMKLTPSKSEKLIKSGLDYLSISLDGATKESYEIFRKGGKFKQVVTNIAHLVKTRNAMKSLLKIEIQFIIMQHNEHEISDIEKLAKNLQVDRLRLKTLLIKDALWKNYLPKNEIFSRYSQKHIKDKCLKPLKELVINCDGTVIPCCYIVKDDINKFKMGNIFKNSLKEIISSKKYQDFVITSTTQKNKLSSCINCNEGNQPLDYRIIEFTNE